MGRPAKYSEDAILDAAADLIGEGGPAALTIAAVAERLGAPSGSIYHRFESRDVLTATLWLRTVERFQAGWADATDHPDPRTAIRAATRFVVDWCRTNVAEAQLLLLWRSSDLVSGDWPPELEARNRDQRAHVGTVVADLSRRLGIHDDADLRRLLFAVIDIPTGAVRESLARGAPPGPELDDLVDDAVAGVIEPLLAAATSASTPSSR